MDISRNSNFDTIIFNLKEGNYRYIGSGSGRRVFDLGNGYVVKVAKNKKGIAQNMAEYQISSTNSSKLFANIIRVSIDFHFLIMEKAEPVQNFSDILKYFKVKSNRELFQLDELTYILSQNNLLQIDLSYTSNWGIIGGCPVIIDYGFTSVVKRKYYQTFRLI